MSTRFLLPLAAALVFFAAAGTGAAETTNISGTFTYEDCGPGHAVTVGERSRISLALTLSESTVSIEVELRGPFGDVTRSDGGGQWYRDVFTAGSYTLRICGKQRSQSDPPVSYTGTVTTGPTPATPQQGGGPSEIKAGEDTRSTLKRKVSGSGAIATARGTATFTVTTVNGVVKLTYSDRAAGVVVRPTAKVRAQWGLNSVTVVAGRVKVMLIDQGRKQDRLVATATGYRAAGKLVRGSLTVL